MYYVFVTLINNTPQMVTLNSLTGFNQENMFVTDASLTVSWNGGQCPVVANASVTGSMTYNITEDMLLVLNWVMEAAEAPSSFVATVAGGTEYNAATAGPVISTDPDDDHDTHYTYTVTLGPVSESS